MASQRKLWSRNQFVLMLDDDSSKLKWSRLLDDNQESWRKSLLYSTALPHTCRHHCSCFVSCQKCAIWACKHICLGNTWNVLLLHVRFSKFHAQQNQPCFQAFSPLSGNEVVIELIYFHHFFTTTVGNSFPSKYIGKWKEALRISKMARKAKKGGNKGQRGIPPGSGATSH